MTKTVIGWSEYVDFPDWGIHGVKAKVDTGARTSALHVEDLTLLDKNRVGFHVVYARRPPFKRHWVETDLLKRARVRSSTGVYTTRCFVQVRIRLGPVTKQIELSLVSRQKMLFRMLLGRTALQPEFLVDVARRKVISSRPPRRVKRARKTLKKPEQQVDTVET